MRSISHQYNVLESISSLCTALSLSLSLTFHFFSPPVFMPALPLALSLEQQERPLDFVVGFLVSAERTRTYRSYARPSVGTGYGGGTWSPVGRGAYIQETSGAWKTAEGEERLAAIGKRREKVVGKE